MYGLIYKITNKINGKSYVGLTTKTLSERFQAHCDKANHEKSVVQKAIKKYGKENFSIELLDTASTKEELISKEIYWISTLNTYKGYGYNQTLGGDGITNMSEEIRNKISVTKKGSKVDKLKGRVRNNEEKIKISRGLGGSKVKLTHKTGEVIILEWLNQARDYNLNPTLICAVLKGNRPHHKGYFAEYIGQANTEGFSN